MENRSKSKLTEWLEHLQQESWQLELLVSGFAIFLLIGTYEPLRDIGRRVMLLASDSREYAALMIPYAVLLGAWFALLINLIIHVLLRGLWISTIGLRYVSDDIDFEYFRFAPRFERYLKRRVGSFDRYIERLEKICSIIFAFTFLVIFTILSFGIFIGLIFLFNVGMKAIGLQDSALSSVIDLLFLLTALIYFIDFVSLGRIKRIKWLSKVYYPIYRFYGWMTFSFMYRPMYYNLIDNKFGRWVGLLLIPYIIFAMVAGSIKFVTHAYFPDRDQGRIASLSTLMYDDLRDDKARTNQASIPSKYVNNGYLELFLPYNPHDDDKSIKHICPDVTPAKSTGIKLEGMITFNYAKDADPDSLLTCLSTMHELYVNDSLLEKQQFHFYKHPKRDNIGLLTILDVNFLPRGRHTLKVRTQLPAKVDGRDTIRFTNSALIPFWKE